jgi:hypothetical protein
VCGPTPEDGLLPMALQHSEAPSGWCGRGHMGRSLPHPRNWQKLAKLVGVSEAWPVTH